MPLPAVLNQMSGCAGPGVGRRLASNSHASTRAVGGRGGAVCRAALTAAPARALSLKSVRATSRGGTSAFKGGRGLGAGWASSGRAGVMKTYAVDAGAVPSDECGPTLACRKPHAHTITQSDVCPSASVAFENFEMDRGFCDVNITGVKYSPEMISATVLKDVGSSFEVAMRGFEITTRLGLYFAALALDELQGLGEERDRIKLRASQLRETLSDLGPSFIKAGQVLANRPDIIREDYMNELCVLQDDVPAFPNQAAFDIMEETLGRPLEEVFSEITKEPIAAASLGQVYRGRLVATGQDVAIKVLRPGIEPVIYRDLFLFRWLGRFVNTWSLRQLGCNAQLIVDEFGEKLLEELDYLQEARNIRAFYENFKGDKTVKIPEVYSEYCGPRLLVMEWIDGIRCTDPKGIVEAGIDVNNFISVGVSSGLRQLLEFGLFHGDPHPGNIFALKDGRIAYVDFGNVAELSDTNKQILIDAVVHAVNEDYEAMAGDFVSLGFLAKGTDITPIVPALEEIWQDSLGQTLDKFNFRTVTLRFNELVYQYPIRIPERYSLVIRSLLTQEGICMTLKPDFKFLEVAYPYVAQRLLTDTKLRGRLIQVLFKDGSFQWDRLENLIALAKEGPSGGMLGAPGGPDLSTTLRDGVKVLVLDDLLRRQLVEALTADSRLHVDEAASLLRMLGSEVDTSKLARDAIRDLPNIGRDLMLSWSAQVLSK